jgi:hypothetical protein
MAEMELFRERSRPPLSEPTKRCWNPAVEKHSTRKLDTWSFDWNSLTACSNSIADLWDTDRTTASREPRTLSKLSSR